MMRVREDDMNAFTELTRKYQPRLIRLMHTIGPRHDMAEDLMQETFMRVYKARKRYVPGAKFSTWLFTIAGNVAKNAKRSVARRREVSEVDAPKLRETPSGAQVLASSVMDASGLMPTRLVEGGEQDAVVRAAVNTLSERQRMAMVLSRFENMSYAEIGEAMELSTKAVKSLLSRARVNLRDVLQSYVDTGVIPKEMQ